MPSINKIILSHCPCESHLWLDLEMLKAAQGPTWDEVGPEILLLFGIALSAQP
jgi:hypothetical protein